MEGNTGVTAMLTNVAFVTTSDAIPDTPLFANTGVRIDNVREIFAICDGCVIGTHFKVDGDTWNAVDGDRVKRFMEVVDSMG